MLWHINTEELEFSSNCGGVMIIVFIKCSSFSKTLSALCLFFLLFPGGRGRITTSMSFSVLELDSTRSELCDMLFKLTALLLLLLLLILLLTAIIISQSTKVKINKYGSPQIWHYRSFRQSNPADVFCFKWLTFKGSF